MEHGLALLAESTHSFAAIFRPGGTRDGTRMMVALIGV
jgi:hypothetical protein